MGFFMFVVLAKFSPKLFYSNRKKIFKIYKQRLMFDHKTQTCMTSKVCFQCHLFVINISNQVKCGKINFITITHFCNGRSQMGCIWKFKQKNKDEIRLYILLRK